MTARTRTRARPESRPSPKELAVEERSTEWLTPHASNPRKITAERREQLKRNMLADRDMLHARPVIALPDGTVIAGNQRLLVARELGWDTIPAVVVDLDAQRARLWQVRDNETMGSWDEAGLGDLLAELERASVDLDLTGLEPRFVESLMRTAAFDALGVAHGRLAEQFVVAPFSVLDARQGAWQDRRREWLALGIRSELGRDAGRALITNRSGSVPDVPDGPATLSSSGASIFDPVVCELVYRWFTAPGAGVLDPFAGGSVRGIVAAVLGRSYVGVDLRAEQVAANRVQAAEILLDGQTVPAWHAGDSRDALPDTECDLVFTCPPYGDLEVYSDDPRDLSAMTYTQFLTAYREIVKAACARLRPDRFAAVVVGDLRDSRGAYRGLVGDTIEAFRAAGCRLYNEAILVQPVGSLPVRVGKQFTVSRKLGKTHQNLLVFVKGDARKATERCGPVEAGQAAQNG